MLFLLQMECPGPQSSQQGQEGINFEKNKEYIYNELQVFSASLSVLSKVEKHSNSQPMESHLDWNSDADLGTPKRLVEVLTPSFLECDLIWHQVITGTISYDEDIPVVG